MVHDFQVGNVHLRSIDSKFSHTSLQKLTKNMLKVKNAYGLKLKVGNVERLKALWVPEH